MRNYINKNRMRNLDDKILKINIKINYTATKIIKWSTNLFASTSL